MNCTHIGSWTVYRYGTVDSTQHVAARLVAQSAEHRTAVIADRQTAGYGRKGDTWYDEPGASLLASLILRPSEARALPQYAMIAALAVVDAVAAVGGLRACIKWPNDVLLNDRKVAGILGDATWRGPHLEAIRLGIGINIGGGHASFARRGLPGATSIAAEISRDIDRDVALAALLDHFATHEDRLDSGGAVAIVAAWRQAMMTIGQAVVVTLLDGRVIRGTAECVTSDGDVIVVAVDGARIQLTPAETRSCRVASER